MPLLDESAQVLSSQEPLLHHPKIFVLSGSFSVGKSTLLEALAKKHGDMLDFISDGGRAVIMKVAPEGIENISLEKRKNLQKGVFEYYLERELPYVSSGSSKLAISDASMIEVAAYSDGLLDEDYVSQIHECIKERAEHYCILKLPVGVTPLYEDGIRNEDLDFQREVDERMNKILDMYPHIAVTYLPVECSLLEDRVAFAEELLRTNGFI